MGDKTVILVFFYKKYVNMHNCSQTPSMVDTAAPTCSSEHFSSECAVS